MARTQERKAIDAVYEAVRAHPNSTVRQLTEITKLGKSTVGKHLVSLESKGLVERHKGEDRAPEDWNAKAEQSSPKKDRLAKGELRARVFDYLKANAGEAFTSTQISKKLYRSSGATTNALVRLAQDGNGVAQVADSPRRYAFTEG